VIVEAKKNDIEAGLGPCIAQMVAARIFNGPDDLPGRSIFGCVTTGEVWQFLRLSDGLALIDGRRYYLDNVGAILANFRAIIAGGRVPAGPVPG